MSDDITPSGQPPSSPIASADSTQSVAINSTQNGGHSASAITQASQAAQPQSALRERSPQASAFLGGVKNTFSSLSNRDFLLLWLGMLFLMGGTQMQMLAQGYLVYDITGSGTVLGIVNLGIAVPMLTIPIFGGAIADRFERKTIIQGAQLVAASLAIFIGVMIHFDMIAWQHIMISSMVQGGLWAFLMPSRQAIIPQLVGSEKLPNALALNAAGMSATTMAAPAMAGWLYAHFGPWNVYYIVAFSSLIAVLLTSMISKTSVTQANKNASMLKDIQEGFTYVAQRPILIVLLLIALGTTMLAMPFRFILPVFVVDIYNLGPDSMGLLVSVMGLGALVGALYVAAVGRRNRGLLLIVSSFLTGTGLLLIALIPVYSIAAMIMVILGLGDSGRMSINQALIIEETEDRYRGRVMSIYMMNFGLMPLGTFPVALFTDYVGGQAVIGVLGLLMLVVAVIILLTQKQLRKMP